MKSYLITDIDEEAWSLFKAGCALRKLSVKSVFHAFIREIVHEVTQSDYYKDIVKIHSEKEGD